MTRPVSGGVEFAPPGPEPLRPLRVPHNKQVHEMSNDNKPPIDWLGQARYFALIVVGVVAVLLLLRYLGLRG